MLTQAVADLMQMPPPPRPPSNIFGEAEDVGKNRGATKTFTGSNTDIDGAGQMMRLTCQPCLPALQQSKKNCYAGQSQALFRRQR